MVTTVGQTGDGHSFNTPSQDIQERIGHLAAAGPTTYTAGRSFIDIGEVMKGRTKSAHYHYLALKYPCASQKCESWLCHEYCDGHCGWSTLIPSPYNSCLCAAPHICRILFLEGTLTKPIHVLEPASKLSVTCCNYMKICCILLHCLPFFQRSNVTRS